MSRLDSFPVAFVAGLVVIAGMAVVLAGGPAVGGQPFGGSQTRNPSGFQQAHAEQTGQQSSAQVSNRLEVTRKRGTVSDGRLGTVRLTVRRAPGAAAVDLSATNVALVSDSGTVTLDYGDETPSFTLESVRDDDNSIRADATLNDADDRAVVVIDASQPDVPRLGPGDQAAATLTTADGAKTTVTLEVPGSVRNGTAVSL